MTSSSDLDEVLEGVCEHAGQGVAPTRSLGRRPSYISLDKIPSKTDHRHLEGIQEADGIGWTVTPFIRSRSAQRRVRTPESHWAEEGEYVDDTSEKPLDAEEVRKRRAEEMAWIDGRQVFTKVPMSQCLSASRK